MEGINMMRTIYWDFHVGPTLYDKTKKRYGSHTLTLAANTTIVHQQSPSYVRVKKDENMKPLKKKIKDYKFTKIDIGN